MNVAPILEGAFDLLVTELPARLVTVVSGDPSHAQRAQPDGDDDEGTVANAAGLPLDAKEGGCRHQVTDGVGPFVPGEHDLGGPGKDGLVGEDGLFDNGRWPAHGYHITREAQAAT